MAFPGYQVWTQNTSPEWLAKCGVGDMLLATGLTEQQANSLAERLREAYGDPEVTAISATERYGVAASKG